MDIELTDLEEILLYLETTSLEPHNDYTSEFTYKDPKILYKYIKELQQENKQLKDNWNKLREVIRKKQDYYRYVKDNRYRKFLSELLDKMQELEQGSDE